MLDNSVASRRKWRQAGWGIGLVCGSFCLLLLVAKSVTACGHPLSPCGFGLVVLFYALVVVAMGVWLYVLRDVFRSPVCRAIMFSALFVWGSASYYRWPVERDLEVSIKERPVLMIEAMNRVFASCFSGSNFEDVPGNGSRLNYELFHLALILALGGTAFALWGTGFVNLIRWKLTRDRNLCVIWGVNEPGLLLAKDVISHDVVSQIEFNVSQTTFEDDDGEAVLRPLRGVDCFWRAVDFSRISASDVKGCEHYFLSESGNDNVRLADQLVCALPDESSGPPKTFHVRIDSSVEEQSFYDWADSVKGKVDVVIVRESEMVARRLVHDYPILETCPDVRVNENGTVAGGIRLLLVGFGSVGWDVLEKIIGDSRFAGSDGKELSVSCLVVDDNDNGWNEFSSYCPEAVSSYNISFESRNVGSAEFPEWVASHFHEYNRIVIAFPNDDRNIDVLERIRRSVIDQQVARRDDCLQTCGLPRMFVYVQDPDRMSRLEKVRVGLTKDDLMGSVRFFGARDGIYTRQIMNFDCLYDVAAVLNAYYETGRWMDWREDQADIEKFWRLATWESRMSSLASAAGEWNALRLLGFDAIGDSVTPACTSYDEHIEDKLDLLARNEHFRWNAWHRMHGYRRWDLKNPPIENEKEKKANKLKAFRRHAAIVDYDELPTVDLQLARAIDAEEADKLPHEVFMDDGTYLIAGKTFACDQKKDRDFCRAIGKNISLAGFTIVRKMK